MKIAIKSSLLLVVLLMVSLDISAEKIQINDFSGLYKALTNGESVRVVIHYGKTRLISDNEEINSPDAIGGMNLETFEYFPKMSINNPKAMIVSSESVLIAHFRSGYVYNYVRIRFYEDNGVQITARYLTVDGYEEVMDEKFYGKINDSKNGEGVYLYLHK